MNNYVTIQKHTKNWSVFLGEGHTLLHSNAWSGTQYIDQDGLELAWFSLSVGRQAWTIIPSIKLLFLKIDFS